MFESDIAKIIEDFDLQLEKHTRQAHCGKPFVQVERLQDWLRSSGPWGGTYADRLLHRVAYRDRTGPGWPNISAQFGPGDECCLLVFCILLKFGCGDLIDVFTRKAKCDQSLPLQLTTLEAIFGNAGLGLDAQDLARQFDLLQHRFRPAKFELQRSLDWDENTVLPIYNKILVGRGATATVWQIDVPEECVGPNLRNVCAGSRFNAGTNSDPDWVCSLQHL